MAVISDSDSWVNSYIPHLLMSWLEDGHSVRWGHNPDDLRRGDFCFLLGCGKMISNETMSHFRHNLVVHESALPVGKGWSPLTWKLLEGKNKIPVTLIEADDQVDSGDIYLQQEIYFEGHELVHELRQKQARATIELCRRFVKEYPVILEQRRKQTGQETFYPRRWPKDSRLDPDKNLREQFNLLRVVDNDRYPAFFELNDQKYLIKILKESCR